MADIQKAGKFNNPPGIENKYFSTTKEGAQQYGDMAQKAFKDGPYSVVETSIPTNQIAKDMQVTVDSGIKTVTVPTDKLNQLTKPKF